mgnify:CR=1 FL=1
MLEQNAVHIGIAVEIIDDGCGATSITPGRGLHGIQNRMQKLAGSMAVDLTPQGGTCVSLRFPLPV